VPTVTNKPLLQTGKGVFQSDLEVLLFHNVGMHTSSPNIEEVMEFQKRLIVKLIPEKKSSLEISFLSSVRALEKNTF
jgi:hypothetical protein